MPKPEPLAEQNAIVNEDWEAKIEHEHDKMSSFLEPLGSRLLAGLD